MSNFLAIATVTATLKQILQTTVSSDVSGANATALRPNELVNNNVQGPGVNIYLYQVIPNAAWRNSDLPTRRPDGQMVQRPQIALDLYYMLTFYGNENEFELERLLGSVARTLHAQPVLTRQVIQKSIQDLTSNPGPGIDLGFLSRSNLADQVELVRFTPVPLSLEELSKLWSVFFQTAYRLSIAYKGTVVLIESEEAPQEALPVRVRNVYAISLLQPAIEQVSSQAGVNQPIVAGGTLLLTGRQLRGDITRMRFGRIEVTPAPQDVSGTQIRLQLASPPIPASALRAGVQGIQVIHQIPMGTPLVPHSGVESNVAAFVLHPRITAASAGATEITVTVDPPIGKAQRVILLLNEFNPPSNRPARAYSFDIKLDLQPNQEETNSFSFAFIETVDAEIKVHVPSGQYLVRVQVDGAQSVLQTDAAIDNPRYIGPTVNVS